MKKILTTLVLLSLIVITNAQIGIQTNSPDASAALDIVATDKGLLIPRVTLTNDLTNASPVTSPATGLLVFNTGANQAVGLYYWNGSSWNLFNSGSISTDYWNLSGNAGTTVGTNFIGTTDAVDFTIYSNNSERMRVEQDGQVIVGAAAPTYASDMFTAIGSATQTYAVNGYGNDCGVFGSGGSYGLYGAGGTFGVRATVNSSGAYGSYISNGDANGWGAIFAGSANGGILLTGHSAGASSVGNDGIFASGKASDGIGVIAGGSGVSTFSTIPTGTGGAFTGYHGLYGSATSTTDGVGVIGVGNDHGTYNTTSNGSGGAFTGYHGLISTAYNTAGTGVIGVGNGGSYYLYPSASGGSFTGDYCGVAGWASVDDNNSVGVYGYYDGVGSNRDGRGVVGIAAANSGRGYGVYGQGNRYGVYANGNLGASGTKTFAIDHPDDPENKILKHFSVESNEVLNMYRGNVILDNSGEATVSLPDYFMTININFSYVLTPVGQKAPDIFIKREIDENGNFEIGGGNAGQKISWVVYADRNDPYMVKYKDREVDVIEKDAEERGKYIMPELYNQPPEKGLFYNEKQTSTYTTPQKPISNNANKVKYEELRNDLEKSKK